MYPHILGDTMKLKEMKEATLLKHLRDAEMSKVKYDQIADCIKNQPISYSTDNKFTVILVGLKVGVAKRCTYAKKRDEQSLSRGIAIATSRALLEPKF